MSTTKTVSDTTSERTRTGRRRRARRGALMGVLSVAALALAGCGLESSAAYVAQPGPGSIHKIDGAKGHEIIVTSKNFTEQKIIGKIGVLTARAAGFDVKDLTSVPGSQPARDLLASGGADVLFDYTGTAWLTYLGHEKGFANQKYQWQRVHDQDLKNGLTWGKPGPMDNTYAFAVAKKNEKKLKGISTLSGIKKLPVKDRTFCVESEFYSRQDGFEPMLKKYGLTYGKDLPKSNVAVLDTGAVYEATARGTCNFGEVFTTDGRIKSLNLKVLKDDKGFFPSYSIAPILRTPIVKKYPQLLKDYERVAHAMTNDKFVELNRKVDVDGQDPSDVAYDWMVKEGFISKK